MFVINGKLRLKMVWLEKYVYCKCERRKSVMQAAENKVGETNGKDMANILENIKMVHFWFGLIHYSAFSAAKAM